LLNNIYITLVLNKIYIEFQLVNMALSIVIYNLNI